MNTFGSATLQFALCDPRSVRENRWRFRRDSLVLLERANSFYCPTGRWASKGWILLPRSEYDQLDKYSTALQLNISATAKPNNVSTLKNLSIVQARCVTRGLSADTDALYLVEITDGRGLLHNEWYQCPTGADDRSAIVPCYNIRSPAYPQTFHPGSMFGDTTWTWATMLEDMWFQMNQRSSNALGAWPGLPSAPAGTPEGFWFPGVPAWTALCDILDHLGMTVACDLTQDSPFTIVSLGAADAMAALKAKYATNLEDDLEWIDIGAARVPATVEVLFKRRNSVYGTEETVRYDTFQWDMTPLYSVTVSAPAEFAAATGVHHLWSDFTVRYDMDGTPLAADTATAAAIAQERVTQYFARIVGTDTQTYAGALPFATGPQVHGVCWSQDYMNQERQGWRTQLVRGPQPPWPGVWV